MVDSTNPRVMADNIKMLAASSGGTTVEANPEGAATAELEKIGIGEIIYNIPEVIYSLNERLVGKFLNSPLYEKTIKINSLVVGENSINHEISGISEIVNIFGKIDYSGDCLPLPYSATTATYTIGIQANGTRILFNVGSSFDPTNFDNIYVTLRYTKAS